MMVSGFRASVAALLLILSSAAGAHAATVPYRTDAELAAISERIVHGRVLSVRTEEGAGGVIHTIARIAVLEDFTGNADSVIEVQELGGTVGARQLVVPGTPGFTVGAELVLCLEHTPAGARYRTVALSFSAFSVQAVNNNSDAALTREMQHIDLVGAPVAGQASSARLLSEFRRTVARVKGRPSVRPAGAASLQPDADASTTPVSDSFRLLANMRWMQADTATPVTWYRDSSSGPAPIGNQGSVDSLIATALAAWTNPTTASLVLSAGGLRARSATNIYCDDAVNLGSGIIMFGDPGNEMGTGTLAIGGGCSGSVTKVVNGTVFSNITHAFVSFNDQSANTDLFFQRVMTHEIGHGIGLAHPCETSSAPVCTSDLTVNLMYPSCCYPNMPIPPALGPDDLAGVNFIYPDAGTPEPDPLDGDGDGMPNAWELQYGLDPTNPADATADPDGDGFTNLQEYQNGTHPKGVIGLTRFFAEGAVNSFFDTQFAVVNYGVLPANVLIRLQPQPAVDGATATLPEASYYLRVPALSRATVTADTLRTLVSSSFATVIETDRPIVVDRTMSWGGGYGSHAETAVTSPGTTWYLAEGAIGGRFSLYYLLQNPNPTAVIVKVTYLRRYLKPVSKEYTIAPRARKTIDVSSEGLESPDDISGVIEVESGGPIIAERAMYRSVPGQLYGAGHESAGVTAPKTSWFLAEGATGSFFDMFVLIANPSPAAAQVHVTYLLEGGATLEKTYAVAANSRFTIPVDDEQIPENSGIRPLRAASFSTRIDSTQPIIVERSMWWPGGSDWYEAHNVVAAPQAGLTWALAEGQAAGTPFTQTYILVANVGDLPTRLRVTLFREPGTCGNVAICEPLTVTTAEVPAHSRTTIEPGTSGQEGWFPSIKGYRFGALIESLDGQGIVIERSMYSDFGGVHWAAGTAAIGTVVVPVP
jgi:hypothetical protein